MSQIRLAAASALLAAWPCLAEGANKWKKIWAVTAGILGAAHIADVASSRGMPESNPLLRDGRGQFDVRRGVLIKVAASGALLTLQGILIQREPDRNLYKPFAVINLGAAAAVGAVAVHNHRIRAPAPE